MADLRSELGDIHVVLNKIHQNPNGTSLLGMYIPKTYVTLLWVVLIFI